MCLLNATEAMEYLKIKKAENFRKLVNNGEIGFKIIGTTKFYPVMELERWLRELNYISSTKEGTRGGRTSQYRHHKGIIGLDALHFRATKNKLNSIATKG